MGNGFSPRWDTTNGVLDRFLDPEPRCGTRGHGIWRLLYLGEFDYIMKSRSSFHLQAEYTNGYTCICGYIKARAKAQT